MQRTSMGGRYQMPNMKIKEGALGESVAESKTEDEWEENLPEELGSEAGGLCHGDMTMEEFDDDQTALNFCDSFLGEIACVRLMEKVRSSTSLVRLDLKGNGISGQGAMAIADALRVNRSITTLSLEWNNIGMEDSSVRALASSLEVNQSLIELDLRNNMIGPEGGASLARGLARNMALRVVDLRWNEIGVSGGRSLAVCLKDSNRTLQDLKVSGNNIDSRSIDEINQYIERNRHPEAEVVVGQARIAAMAARLRQCPSFLTKQGEIVSEITVEKLEEDRKAFADRIVELEMEIKELNHGLEEMKKSYLEEKDLRERTEQKLKEAQKFSDQFRGDNEILQKQIEQHKHFKEILQKDLTNSQSRIIELQREVELGKGKLEEQSQAHLEAVRALERERSLRVTLEDKLEQSRAEKLTLLGRIETSEQNVDELREAVLREKLKGEEEVDKVTHEYHEKLRLLESKLEAEIRARADDARKNRASVDEIREDHLRTEKQLSQIHQEALDELEKRHCEEIARLHVSFQEQTAEIRKAQGKTIEDLSFKHEQELKLARAKFTEEKAKDIEIAVEKAVEVALAETVQRAVSEAAKELEADHKRILWKREKELQLEAKEHAQAKIDAVLEEKSRLEADIVKLKSTVVEMEAAQSKQLAKLKERMRQAVSDACL